MKRTLAGLVSAFIFLAMIGCAPATVSNQKIVQISYKGTLADGSTFSQSDPAKPLEFMVGAGTLIPTLEKGMLGMKAGEKRTITVKAADAYGEYDKAAVQEVPRSQFPKGETLTIGEKFQVNGPTGPMVVSISGLTPNTVTVDFNHPLAGKDLTFEVMIVKIRDATKEELSKAASAAAGQATPKK